MNRKQVPNKDAVWKFRTYHKVLLVALGLICGYALVHAFRYSSDKLDIDQPISNDQYNLMYPKGIDSLALRWNSLDKETKTIISNYVSRRWLRWNYRNSVYGSDSLSKLFVNDITVTNEYSNRIRIMIPASFVSNETIMLATYAYEHPNQAAFSPDLKDIVVSLGILKSTEQLIEHYPEFTKHLTGLKSVERTAFLRNMKIDGTKSFLIGLVIGGAYALTNYENYNDSHRRKINFYKIDFNANSPLILFELDLFQPWDSLNQKLQILGLLVDEYYHRSAIRTNPERDLPDLIKSGDWTMVNMILDETACGPDLRRYFQLGGNKLASSELNEAITDSMISLMESQNPDGLYCSSEGMDSLLSSTNCSFEDRILHTLGLASLLKDVNFDWYQYCADISPMQERNLPKPIPDQELYP